MLRGRLDLSIFTYLTKSCGTADDRSHEQTKTKGVPSVESSHSVRGLGKGVSGKPYPRMCNARRPRLEPGTFWSQAVRLYRLHQARPSFDAYIADNYLLSSLL